MHGGEFGYGHSYLDSVFRYSKVFRLHAIIHDATGAVGLKTSKGPGYCYIICRAPNCCLLGHVSGLSLCLYIKILSNLYFNLIDFRNSTSLILLDIAITEKDKITELGFFFYGFLQEFSLCPLNTYKSNERTTWNTSHLHGNAWSSGKLVYDKLFAVSYDIKLVNAEVFAKEFERKCRLLTRLLGQSL